MAILSLRDRILAKTNNQTAQVVPTNQARGAGDDSQPASGKLPSLESGDVIKAVVERFNANSFVTSHGTGVAAYSEQTDYELDRPVLVPRTIPAFRELHRSDVIMLPTGKLDDAGQPVMKPTRSVDLWLDSPDRRCYLGGIALFPNGGCPPDTYNLYRGWGVEAVAGDVTFIIGYIEALLCSGNTEQFEYLMNWLAYCVQYPERQAEVAVVLRGLKGTGKSTLGRLMVTIFGAHGMQITHARHLLGNFNGHMRSTLLLFADEAFFAGDAQGASVLKGLITEDYLVVEQKGVDPVQVRNRLKIMMASNSDWVVPASGDERRFFVLEVSDERQGDHAYWSDLNKHIANGGAGAFLHYLLTRDLSRFNVRDVPQTDGLSKQKLQSLGALDGFLFDALSMGSIDGQVWEKDRALEMSRTRFGELLEAYCQKHPRHRYNIPSSRYTGLHIFEMVGAVKARRPNGQRENTYKFPSLDDARATFSLWARLGDDFDWEDA